MQDEAVPGGGAADLQPVHEAAEWQLPGEGEAAAQTAVPPQAKASQTPVRLIGGRARISAARTA